MTKDVYLITGFPGSGKTTFINKILSYADMKNSAVILNEFGDMSVDAHLLPSGSLLNFLKN